MAKIDKSKFPLIGIAKFLENETQDSEKDRRMAKAVLTRTVEKSETATKEDKEEAKAELGELEGRMREASGGRLSNAIIMKNPNDLKILSGLERMYIALPHYNLMKENIQDHGVQVPVIITKDDEIIDGRNRWTAAKELGIKEIPTILNTETRLPEIMRLMLSYNVCRRQLSQEERIHYVKVLKELGKSKKGRGRPSKPSKIDTNEIKELRGEILPRDQFSSKTIAKDLGVSERTVQRDAQKEEGRPRIRREWDEETKDFRMVVGKSKETDERFLMDIHKYIDAVFENMQPEKGDRVEFMVISKISKKVE